MMSLSSRSVTGALPCGQTTRAFFQSSSVQNGGASGSSATARSISSSVSASTRAQSVSLFIFRACFSETRVIRSSLISSCPPGTNDAAAIVTPCVDDLRNPAIQFAKRLVPALAIISAAILGLDETPGEHLDRIDKVDAMLEDIGLALRLVPFAVHRGRSNTCTYCQGDIPDAFDDPGRRCEPDESRRPLRAVRAGRRGIARGRSRLRQSRMLSPPAVRQPCG